MNLYQSNLLEKLFEELSITLAAPLPDPLAPEIIVVQNPGMGRWLSQRIAVQTGISANLQFPLPGSFIRELFVQTLGGLPDCSDFDQDVLFWRVLEKLSQLLNEPCMTEINGYLAQDRDGSRKFQLAEKITDLLDQYLVYRPDLIHNWQQGREEHWQAVLWRSLTEEGSGLHRADLLFRFEEQAQKGALQTDTLPQRVCLFGINSLAPAYLRVIELISPHCEIHIFHLSPCCHLWDDILPERTLARKRRERDSSENSDEYYTSGNPLLASMGRVGKDFFRQLMELQPIDRQLYASPAGPSLLGDIQGDILDLIDSTKADRIPLEPQDNSISFHSCHSPMREVQVLHDRLLDLFAADPELKPADILVTAPDINKYAPAVAGVFGSAAEHLRIPWTIADRSGSSGQPAVDGFLQLLEIFTSRFTAPDVTGLLENPVIAARFELSEDDFSLMRSRIHGAGIRWGLDREQRKTLSGACGKTGEPESSDIHSWDFGINRMLMGYLTGPLDAPMLDILPAGGTINDTGNWLGSLTGFVRRLQSWQQRLQNRQSPASWNTILQEIIRDFLEEETSSASDTEGLVTLRESIADFSGWCDQAGFKEPVNLTQIRSYFERKLASPMGGQAFLSGRVTFCNMVPMRSVPFKVIWLLGMNDRDYPRSQRPEPFDIIAQKPRMGDRSRRDDDRYLFLEALLSARSHFGISWVGRNQQDNAEQPPSVVVAELSDYIDRSRTAADDGSAFEALTTSYPLQPFSRLCFSENSKTASYAAEWLPEKGTIDGEIETELPFFTNPLPEENPAPEQLELGTLVRFWKYPVRFFLTQRLGLRQYREDDLLAESESFSLDNLQNYLLTQDIIEELLSGSEQEPLPAFYRMSSAAELPGGEFGTLLYEDQYAAGQELILQLEQLVGEPVDSVAVKLDFDDCPLQLCGRLASLYRVGRVSFRPATIKANDYLSLWVHHLVLLLVRPAGVEPVSIHLGKDQVVCFREVENPGAYLVELLNLYRYGMLEPLHFYPKSSYAYADAIHKKGKDRASAWMAARKAWLPGFNDFPGEGDDQEYEIALRGQEPLDDRFEELADLFNPILDHLEPV